MFYLLTSPTEKGGSRGREGGGGKVSPGFIMLMNPGPFTPVYLWGWHVGGFDEPPSAKGEF